MPNNFKFKVKNLQDHIRIKSNGSYEIRYMIDGVNISGCGKTVELAKARFLVNFKKSFERKEKISYKNVLFIEFAERWFIEVKRPTVKSITFNFYKNLLENHIKPSLKKDKLKDITPLRLQPLFNKLTTSGQTKTAADVKLLLKQIFAAAIAERIITNNPIDGVKLIKHVSKKSIILDLETERNLMQKLEESPYRLTYALMLYCGTRRAELATIRIDGDFVVIKNGKTRIGSPESFRKVPITPMLKPYLLEVKQQEFNRAIALTNNQLDRIFKKYCPNHHLHELRHTFITRCQECGVARDVVSVWAGHASDNFMTLKTYTHFSREFLKEQGEKVI